MTIPTGEQILATPMQKNDAQASTIREYLAALAKGVWVQGEGFSGKRPFGMSGWHYDLYQALVVAGHIGGELYYEQGYTHLAEPGQIDRKLGDKLISTAHYALASEPPTAAPTTTQWAGWHIADLNSNLALYHSCDEENAVVVVRQAAYLTVVSEEIGNHDCEAFARENEELNNL